MMDSLGRVSMNSPLAFLQFIARLRDATAQARHPVWGGEVAADIDVATLSHLSPPAELEPPHSATAWQAAFHYGLFCYRRGPEFITITDHRPAVGRGDWILDDRNALALLGTLARPEAVPPGDPALASLRSAGLVLGCRGLWVALPYRPGRLPIPTTVI